MFSLPLGEGYRVAIGRGASEVSSDLYSEVQPNIGHYPQPSIHAPSERFSDLRRLFFKTPYLYIEKKIFFSFFFVVSKVFLNFAVACA